MATLHLSWPPMALKHPQLNTHSASCFKVKPAGIGMIEKSRRRPCIIRSYKVVIEHEGSTTAMEVDPDETILSKALDSGLSVPHDCKLGVCMTCPARLLSGSVDQSEGMLSDDVVERGYTLLCVSYPLSDCHIRTIPEDELLSLQLATAND
ncbi:ferredoxin C 1, chloroplastic [Macadamia integrifolia]|uniref:ferredoxin C 1, chloroplastic n=1 Tax=Macadamia integrifolia TaxID=60698 RepID=UPI001C500452|nr:ferredoxin C 1, chloroplastic [Macadamia integrifolia]